MLGAFKIVGRVAKPVQVLSFKKHIKKGWQLCIIVRQF